MSDTSQHDATTPAPSAAGAAPPNRRIPFSEWFSRHREGVADADVSDAMRDVIDACARTGKGGSLTLTIKILPNGDMLAVTDSCKANLPEEPKTAKLYWMDLQGNLTRNNPLQPSLPWGDDTANL